MPNEPSHTTATMLVSTVAVAASLIDTRLAPMVAGCLFGLFCTPDLDLDTHIEIFDKLNNAGQKAGQLWSIYWYPYKRLTIHRGLSHFPILGTLARTAYFPWIVIFIFLLAESPLVSAGLFFAGLAIVDTVHIVWDFALTKVRRAF